MKIFAKLVFILIIALSLISCKTVAKTKNYTNAFVGNTSGNINNGSAMLEVDGWVYYSIGSFGETPYYVTPDDGFYRMKPNGTDKQKINDKVYSALNAYDKSIYSSLGYNDTLKTNTTDLLTANVNFVPGVYSLRMVSVDDRLILSHGDNHSLYSAKNDGTDLVKLSSLSAFRSDFHKGWVYYVTETPVALHRVQIDGTQDVLVSNDIGKDFIIVNDMIYYPSLSDGNKLYAVGLNGDIPVKITENAVSSLNSDGYRIFYIDPTTRKIHALSFNGKLDEPISSHVANRISIAGGWLYYSDNQIPAQIFQISLSNWTEKTFYSLKKDEPLISEVENQGMAISNEDFYSGGFFIQKGEWIYSSLVCIGICRFHIDGTNKTSITNTSAGNLAVVGDWVYFINLENDKLYRIKTDGSELTKVFDTATLNFLINDEWIYLTTKEGGGVIKIKTNGADRIDLFYFPSDYASMMYAIVDDKIYRDDMGTVVEMDFSGKTTLTASISGFEFLNVIVHNGWIYYVITSHSESPDAKFMKIKTDGTSEALVETITNNDRLFGFHEDWLYFSNSKNNEALVRLNVVSGKREVLFKGEKFESMFFLDSKIVLLRRFQAYDELFIADYDGSNQAPFKRD